MSPVPALLAMIGTKIAGSAVASTAVATAGKAVGTLTLGQILKQASSKGIDTGFNVLLEKFGIGSAQIDRVDYDANKSDFLKSLESGGAYSDKEKVLRTELGDQFYLSPRYSELTEEFERYANGMSSIPLGNSDYDYMKDAYEPQWRSYAKAFDVIDWEAERNVLSGIQGGSASGVTDQDIYDFLDLFTIRKDEEHAEDATLALSGKPDVSNIDYLLPVLGIGLIIYLIYKGAK